ncbi:hypothetical protein QT397_11300 [Microbulbifer sp. MKSA007]|nr:hypothetical protein QT397_11300 [Microbulbifer sp. MKSA007]
MAELPSNIYLKLPKSIEVQDFLSLLDSESESDFVNAATILSPEHGLELAKKLLEQLSDFFEVRPESFKKYGSVIGIRYVLGMQAEQILDELLLFYGQLVNPIDLRAYISGDDSWEIFYRVEGGKLIKEHCQADESEVTELIQTVYAWWHQGLPKSIFEGQLIDSRTEVPKPIKPVKIITKTKIKVPDDYFWEMIFFNMIPGKNETPHNDDIHSYWSYSWEGTDDRYQQVMCAFKRLRTAYVRCGVDFKRHEGSGCDITYNFSESSNNSSYALTYALFSALIGAEVKQFVTMHPDFEKHYICTGGVVTVEVRQNKKVISTEIHNVKSILLDGD